MNCVDIMIIVKIPTSRACINMSMMSPTEFLGHRSHASAIVAPTNGNTAKTRGPMCNSSIIGRVWLEDKSAWGDVASFLRIFRCAWSSSRILTMRMTTSRPSRERNGRFNGFCVYNSWIRQSALSLALWNFAHRINEFQEGLFCTLDSNTVTVELLGRINHSISSRLRKYRIFRYHLRPSYVFPRVVASCHEDFRNVAPQAFLVFFDFGLSRTSTACRISP